eukprot:gnl/MRDRNA2_/MRDRNA2_83683_c0_seq1.p1 gnl/MRDRNA2_/MRDRNA2_83683_c0~~gnl/MRDRNA2_/MRDRNA2_83683_c0_seq1.p1  ORF type:complete len:361 (-),score=-9.58 gnl/MRDRNA2_/MRDRNA2_83683_c0_seq1:33-1115(-)
MIVLHIIITYMNGSHKITDTAIMRPSEVLEHLRFFSPAASSCAIKAFYSSESGGICNQSTAMLVHANSSCLGRYPVISDRLSFKGGNIYLLNHHLERLFKSVKATHCHLPFSGDRMKKILLETCAASMELNGSVHVCVYPNKGNVSQSSVFIQVFAEYEEDIAIPPCSVYTSTMPSQFGALAQINSPGLFPELFVAKKPQNLDSVEGIFLDVCGFVAHGGEYNFLIFTKDGRLLVPSFENSYANPTIQRIVELVDDFTTRDSQRNRQNFEWIYKNIKSAEFTPSLCMDEMVTLADELFLVGERVIKVVQKWDGQWIGQQATRTGSDLHRFLCTIMNYDTSDPGYDRSKLTPIPYSHYGKN